MDILLTNCVEADLLIWVLGKHCDANWWSSGRIFLSDPHTNDGFLFSRPPDRAFRCVYPCEIILYHMTSRLGVKLRHAIKSVNH